MATPAPLPYGVALEHCVPKCLGTYFQVGCRLQSISTALCTVYRYPGSTSFSEDCPSRTQSPGGTTLSLRSRHLSIYLCARTLQLLSATETTGRFALVHQCSRPRPPHSLHPGPTFSNSIPHCDQGSAGLFASPNFPPSALPGAGRGPLLPLCPGLLGSSNLTQDASETRPGKRPVRHRSDLPISHALSVVSTASPGANPLTLPARQPIHPIHHRPGSLAPWLPGPLVLLVPCVLL